MADREKLLKEFDYLINDFYPACTSDSYYLSVMEAVRELLKEQEPIKAERECSGSGVTWWNICGNCKTAINPNDKYCHECGRPILWEGR